jgi:hypothetical protein
MIYEVQKMVLGVREPQSIVWKLEAFVSEDSVENL